MKKKLRIDELTIAEKKALVDEICRICEKQFRKGYQHGFFHGKEGLVSEKQVNEFRWKGSEQDYKKVIYPPYFNQKVNPVERILPELSMSEMEILQELFHEVQEEVSSTLI